MKNPAVVLDIDETSLSNWPNIAADDFGFFSNGRCDDPPKGPCGFNAWVLRAERRSAFRRRSIFSTPAKAKGVAIISSPGGATRKRQATCGTSIAPATRDGKAGHAAGSRRIPTVEEFKTAARAKWRPKQYTIIANIGDQLSDIEQQPGITPAARMRFKLPNPFYFIK